MNKSTTALLVAATSAPGACSTSPANAQIGATAGAAVGHEISKRIEIE